MLRGCAQLVGMCLRMDEWTALENYLGANGHSGTEGTALKSTSGWNSGGNGTDDFGFSALPGGYRSLRHGYFTCRDFGYWWSSSPSGGNAWSGTWTATVQPSTGTTLSTTASRSGVLGMPIERSEGGLIL